MEFERRLVAAAELVLSGDIRAGKESLNPAEFGVSATLKPHQVEGVSWLVRRYLLGVNVILGDEMGLGKTLQAIAFLSYLKVHLKLSGPFLVLCPLSVTDCWISELTNFCPTLKVLRYVGDKGLRHGLRRMLYEHLQQELSSSDVLYNVLDQQFIMPRRLLLTGTPIQNNLSELWALMHFCMSSIFGTLEQFVSTFKEDLNEGNVRGQFKILKYILRAFMLRRTKLMLVDRGILMLPPLTEITLMVPLVPLQKTVYVSILRRELSKLLSFSSGTSNHHSLQNTLIQLRKACSHPYLFNGIEPEPYEEGEHLIQASGKLIVLDQLLQKLHKLGHRVLLFAQMTHTLDILQDFLELRKYTYERLDGSVRAEERFAAIRSFSAQSVEGSIKHMENQRHVFVFMISTRAGGVGLNLVAADTVIFYEQDWNPQVDKQALQRAHRIGQTNHVLSINLVSERTIEEVIMRRAEGKLQLSNKVTGVEGGFHGEGKEAEAEVSCFQSLIFGLHIFDTADVGDKSLQEVNMEDLTLLTDKVIELRHHELSEKGDRKFEINPANALKGVDVSMSKTTSVNFDPGVDEASYMSWVEKLKEASQSVENSALELGKRRNVSEEKHLSREAEAKKAEEKRLAMWEALGYHSLAVNTPVCSIDTDVMSDLGSVHFVFGDCTNPSKVCPSEPTVIFSCVDDSGRWGHGGMFDALANLSSTITDAYHRAFECGDLHLGDLHFIEVNGPCNPSNLFQNAPQWVALAVVQSYNHRRKIPRSNISMTDLDQCLSKASFSAAQNSASIHMPRIGYQDGSQRSEWYTVERLLRKYASIYGIQIFVYYYRRSNEIPQD